MAAKAHDCNSAQPLREFVKQQEATTPDDGIKRQMQISLNSANAGKLTLATKIEAKFDTKRTATRHRLKVSK